MQITDRSTVAANIRTALGQAGVSQAALAEAVRLSPNGMSRRMTGEMEFRVSELQAIASHLNVSLEQLLEPTATAVTV